MPSPVPAITCSACGRRFAWKPEYAGKTLKCKCGQPIKAPAAAPAPGPGAARQSAPAPVKKAAPAKQPAVAAPAAVSSGGDDDIADLFGSAQAQYEMAPPPTAPPQRPATVAAAVTGARSPLGYAGTSRKQTVDSGASNGLAVTSLVLGIISCAMFWFCIPWLPRTLGVLAIIFGIRAMTQGGGGKAKAGMILGIVGIVATILFWIVISSAADRIGNAVQKNMEQLQKQAEQMQKEAEEAERKAQENQTTQPAGATRPRTRQNP